MAEDRKVISFKDDFGRRSGVNRRRSSISISKEERADRDRRNGNDRRSGSERRCIVDRRAHTKIHSGPGRRSEQERRSGIDRRDFMIFD